MKLKSALKPTDYHSPKSYITRAMEFVEEGDLSSATTELRKGLEQHPNDEKLHFEYGYLMYEMNDLETSKLHLEKAVVLKPDEDCRKYFTLSELLPSNEAIFLVQKGLNIGLKELTGFEERLKSLTEHEEGLRAKLQRKIRKWKRLLSQGYLKLADIEMEINKLDGNIFGIVQSAIMMDPEFLEPYLHLLTHYFNHQDKAQTENLFKFLLGKLKELEANDDDAIEDYDAEFFNSVARLMIEEQKFEMASEWLEIAVSVHPRDFNAQYLYAFCAFRTEDFDTAQEVCAELENKGILGYEDEELVEAFKELKNELDLKLPKHKMEIEDENDWEDVDSELDGDNDG